MPLVLDLFIFLIKATGCFPVIRSLQVSFHIIDKFNSLYPSRIYTGNAGLVYICIELFESNCSKKCVYGNDTWL